MKKMFGMVMAVVFCGTLLGTMNLFAAETTDSAAMTSQEKLAADKAAVKAQKETMIANGQAAKSEEKDIKAQIETAKLAGDTAKVKELRAQLRATHHENVQQKKENKATLRADKKEVIGDKKQIHQERRAARRS